MMRDGRDAAIVALGHSVAAAQDAAQRLEEHGISAAVLNARFAKPVDGRWLAELARRCRALVVVEEHAAHGGFADAVLASLAAQRISVPVKAVGVPDEIVEHGSQEEWRAAIGLDAEGIEKAVRELLGR